MARLRLAAGAWCATLLCWTAPATGQEVDPSVVRLEWGALNILVISDTVDGPALWAAWSAAGERRGLEADEFVAHYDPDTLLAWLDEAQLLLLPGNADERDPPQLLSPPLTDLHGGRLYAVRLKDRRRWSEEVYFSMAYAPREKPLQFAVSRRHAARLFEVLTAAARASRLVTTPPAPGEVRYYANPADPSTAPEGAGVYGVLYPQYLVDQGIQGDVWFSFVVDTAGGVPRDGSFRVLLSDHPLLTHTARESLRDAVYRPAVRLGRPVAVRVYQRVRYRIRD